MISKNNIKQYNGDVLEGDESCLYIPPHEILRPYISHYCVSFISPQSMSDDYTVLPSANSVLGMFVSGGAIVSSFSGTSSKVQVVGGFANKQDLLLLIKFRAGGFFTFYKFSQNEAADLSFDLNNMDKAIAVEIENELVKSNNIGDLVNALDKIFIKRLNIKDDYISAAINQIVALNGNITARRLSEEFHYSERHIRRLFLQQIGVSVKSFSRIVRVNYALRLLKNHKMSLLDITEIAGFYDQAHFINDFKEIFEHTPSEYAKKMSDFYNAEFI